MALQNIGSTCFVNVALQLYADMTRDNTRFMSGEVPTNVLEATLTYLRCSRNMTVPQEMPRTLMNTLCDELKIKVGMPDDASSVLMQLCAHEGLPPISKCCVTRVCVQCRHEMQIGLPEVPFSLVAVPTSASHVSLTDLLIPDGQACGKCDCEDAPTLAYGENQTLVYLARDVYEEPIHVDFPLSLNNNQELMGVVFWSMFHYSYMSRHKDGLWRHYNDDIIKVLPSDFRFDASVAQTFGDKVVALLYGPVSEPLQDSNALLSNNHQHENKKCAVSSIKELTPFPGRPFGELRPKLQHGPWVKVCLNGAVRGSLLYNDECTAPHITEKNWVVFYDIYDTMQLFLLPASRTYMADKPLVVSSKFATTCETHYPRITVKRIVRRQTA